MSQVNCSWAARSALDAPEVPGRPPLLTGETQPRKVKHSDSFAPLFVSARHWDGDGCSQRDNPPRYEVFCSVEIHQSHTLTSYVNGLWRPLRD